MKHRLSFAFVSMLLLVALFLSVQPSQTQAGCTRLFKPGFDMFGYNYTAHLFRGTYDSSDRNIDGTFWGTTGDFVDDRLMMKWSDDWLTDVDCDGDGKLDRGGPGGGSRAFAWLAYQPSGRRLRGRNGWYRPTVRMVHQDRLREPAQDPNGGRLLRRPRDQSTAWSSSLGQLLQDSGGL